MKLKRKIFTVLIMSVLMLISTISFTVGASAAEPDESTVCEHDYEEAVTSASCTERGYTEYICSLCGDTYKDNYITATGHDFSDLIIPATCTDKGFTTHFCKVCGYQYSENYTEPTGHTYTDVVFEPTCTEVGFTEHTCDNCGETFADTFVEKLGHAYKEEITEATCTEGGYTTFSCDVCGETNNSDYVDPIGHQYSDNIVNATCIAYGYSEHICTGCNIRYVSDYVKPLGHDYKVTVVPAAEEQLGYTKHICKACGNTYLSDFVSSKDNGYIEVPEEPEEPVHTHEYKLSTTVNRTDKLIKVAFDCRCGENGADLVTFLFAANDGDITTVKSDKSGVVDYSGFIGNISVTIVDDYGNVLKEFSIKNGEVLDTPDEPEIPDTPEIPDEPDTPDTPDTPNNPDNQDKPNNQDKPDTPDDSTQNKPEHTHNFVLYSTMNSVDKRINLNYMCECKEQRTSTLQAIFTNSYGNVVMLTPNADGELNCSSLNGKYLYEVKTASGETLSS